jgi:hypothetical protein
VRRDRDGRRLRVQVHLAFSADNATIIVRGGGAAQLTIDGKIVWTAQMRGMKQSGDLRTFAAYWYASHGSTLDIVAALDGNGRKMWQR